MKRKIKTVLLFIVVLSTMAFTVNGVSAKNLGFWWYNTPRTVYVYTGDLNTTEKNVATMAMNVWNAVRTTDNQLMVTFTSTQNDFGADGSISYDYIGSYVGYCNIYNVGDEIRTFQIYLNINMQYYVGAAVGKYDYQTIFEHELGHALGVAHCHESGQTCTSPTCAQNVMNRLAQTNFIRRVLKSYDIASFQYIYMYLA